MEQKDLDKLNEIAKQLIGVEKEVSAKKGEKAQLERDILILKNGVVALHSEFNATNKKYQDEIKHLEEVISKLKTEQENITSALKSKLQGIEIREVNLKKGEGELDKRTQIVSDREERVGKSEEFVKNKLIIVSKITELAKGL